MNFLDKLVIAIDFDGTIVEDAYPKIGKARIFAFETMKRLQQDGHRLILWTYRSGSKLDDAVQFCKENDITFYAVNQSFPEEQYDNKVSRKIYADIYVDDRNIGGVLGWGEVFHLITNETPDIKTTTSKKGFLGLFNK